MKVKFNKFERVAGVFVLTAIVGSVVVTGGVAIKKGWFSSKIEFHTTFESAEGLHAGTEVQVAGLRAGNVEDVELLSGNRVHVRFKVFEKFHSRIRKDSSVQVIRPFIIGEKVLDIIPGSDESEMVSAKSEIPAQESFDFMDLVSGRKLAPFLGTIDNMMENIKVLANAFADPKRTEAFVKMFDETAPLVKNLNAMSIEVVKLTNMATKKRRLEKIIIQLAALTEQMEIVLPEVGKLMPQMSQDIPRLVNNLTVLTDELKKVAPAIGAVAPELPRASVRAVEALDEAVITLKALQRSFLLSGKVEDIKEEEAKNRKPANK